VLLNKEADRTIVHSHLAIFSSDECDRVLSAIE